MHSADAETGAKVRRAAGSSQEGARGSCRDAEAQACCGGLISCSSSRLWYRPAASGPFPPQLSHPHRTGAVEPATAAAPAAPDVAAPAELPLRVGRKRKAPSSPDVVSRSLPVKATAVAPHACADAQGCDSGSDCTALHCAGLRCSALESTVLRCTALYCTCTAPCSALAVVAVVYAHCTRAHAALRGRLVMRKPWWSTRPPR